MAHVNLEASLTPEERGRTTLAAAALEGLLEQYGCQLIAMPFISEHGTIGTEIHVMPRRT